MIRVEISMWFYHLISLAILGVFISSWAEDDLINPSQLEMFVDQLPDMPRIRGFRMVNGVRLPKSLKILMFHKKWKFHRDLPLTPVFAYGTSRDTATVPGPTIEAVYGIDTWVTWENHLPSTHILPWDPTIPTAMPKKGIATVVHVHGSINEPRSDGHPEAWFTARFKKKGPTWSKRKYHYYNIQHPGTLWYHDHTMGLTRVNILAGLMGSYIIRQPEVEDPLGLPHGDEFDRPLIVFDRNFRTNGSIYMNSTGNNPDIHPQWQPEYFDDFIIVNGKIWPYMIVRRRKYRFRIINASNARLFKFYFTNGLRFIYVASDSTYLEKPVLVKEFLLAPSEVADVVVDFANSTFDWAILSNKAPYPLPIVGPVMKFFIKRGREGDTKHVPNRLVKYSSPDLSNVSITRYITMFQHISNANEPTHFDLNGKSYEDPVIETPKVGATEVWFIINLTKDDHPFHIHLGVFLVLDQTQLVSFEEFKECMMRLKDAIKCQVSKYARGRKLEVPDYAKGWKNVYKVRPGYVTKMVMRFSYIHSNASYPFDATVEPGYVYHCHILDHEDNVMMRPLKLVYSEGPRDMVEHQDKADDN